MRTRKKPWAEDELENNPRVVTHGEQYCGKWNTFFGNDNPIHIEIGCGKGQFLAKNAATFPSVNFIGMERQQSVAAVAARKLAPETKNAAILWSSAEALLDYLAPGEIKQIYINFCDPWPKKKQSKRRLTSPIFLALYQQVLDPSGRICFKTDNRGLFEYSLNSFCESNWKLSQITLDLHNSDMIGNIMTEYEERFSQQGMPIYRLEATPPLS